MPWTEFQYQPTDVDAAGAMLLKDPAHLEDFEHALAVIDNWRSSHASPLNTFQMTLRNKARQVEPQSLIAQRVKRLTSITAKLRRLDWLKLSEMQDIAGCRVIMGSVRNVDQLVEVYRTSYIKHEECDSDNYINSPKRSGYRGIHLIYRYYSDKKRTYNGMKVEMQFRTALQHAWATAVETVGTFTKQSLKSSEGEKEWLRFFALMGTAIAFREQTMPVPRTPTNETDLVAELRECAGSLRAEERLRAYGTALRRLDKSVVANAHYFLLVLDPSAETITVTGYRRRDYASASADLLAAERSIVGQSGTDAVLVSVDSLDALRRAYPNYFLDTDVFLSEVRRVLG